MQTKKTTVGELNGNSKLDADKVREIRRRLKAGETAASICFDYGVGRSAINLINTRRTWAHVDP